MNEPRQRKLMWEKWKDPLKTLADRRREKEESGYNDSYSEDGNGSVGPAVVGPMGIIPIHEDNLPGTMYNFWVCHTNFIFTVEDKYKVDMTPGVESFDLFTPLRFRVAIGRLFDENDVMDEITKQLCPQMNGSDNSKKNLTQTRESQLKTPQLQARVVDTELEELKSRLSTRYKVWAIVTLKTGKINVFGGSDTDVRLKVEQVRGNASSVITSWDNTNGTKTGPT